MTYQLIEITTEYTKRNEEMAAITGLVGQMLNEAHVLADRVQEFQQGAHRLMSYLKEGAEEDGLDMDKVEALLTASQQKLETLFAAQPCRCGVWTS